MRGLRPFFKESKVPEKVPDIPNHFFGWFSAIYNTTDKDIFESLGVDAVMFIKFTKTLMHIVLMFTVGAFVLIILNYLSPTKGDLQLPGLPNDTGSMRLESISIKQAVTYAKSFLWVRPFAVLFWNSKVDCN
jgi:hypothetical protein